MSKLNNMTIRLIIAGGRDFTDFEAAKVRVDLFIKTGGEQEITILSGCCDDGVPTFIRDDGTVVYGADGIGENIAEYYGYNVEYFPADWNKYGRPAGPIRNSEMAKSATHCIVFWDRKSKGSKDMIEKAKKIETKIVYY